jgi:hypothetical protein
MQTLSDLTTELQKDGWINRYEGNDLVSKEFLLFNYRIGNCSFALIQLHGVISIEILDIRINDVLMTRYYKDESESLLDFIRRQKKELYEYYNEYVKNNKIEAIENL